MQHMPVSGDGAYNAAILSKHEDTSSATPACAGAACVVIDTSPSSSASSCPSTRTVSPDIELVADVQGEMNGCGLRGARKAVISDNQESGNGETLLQRAGLRAVDSLEFDVLGLEPMVKVAPDDAGDLDRRPRGVGAKLGAKIRRMQSRLANYVG